MGAVELQAPFRVARFSAALLGEPPISGEVDPGAIFFTGCPLRCVFCQNRRSRKKGCLKPVATEHSPDDVISAQGALNINLVTPLPSRHT